jgi:hypothetical protein
MLAACVTSTTRDFLPTPGQRLTTTEARARGDAFLRAECPRLMGEDSVATGAAELGIAVDREGNVGRARLRRSSGDDRMDTLFGGLAAALRFDPPGGMRGDTLDAEIELGYSCSPRAAVMTLRILQPGDAPRLQPADSAGAARR